MTTYYPLKDDFSAKEPGVVSQEIASLVSAYTDKPVYLLEAGYPSSASLGSSEEKQAQFVREMFKAWDIHRARLKIVNFIWLHDMSSREVAALEKYYGVSSTGFSGFLGTLGLRTHDGKDKQATLASMERAVQRLSVPADYLLIDGITPLPLNLHQKTIKKGDSRSLSIAAASVIAKVVRDRIMVAYDKIFPGYGFAGHKGYGSKSHREAVANLGPSPCHRRSFRGVKEFCEPS